MIDDIEAKPRKVYPRRKLPLYLTLEPEVMARLQALADSRRVELDDKRASALNTTALELLLSALEEAECDQRDAEACRDAPPATPCDELDF